jgi:hypothetical protein
MRPGRAFRGVRFLATHATSITRRKLPDGPTLEEFIANDHVDRVVLGSSPGWA